MLMRDSLPILLKGLQSQGWWITFKFKIVLRFLGMRETYFAFTVHKGFSTHIPHVLVSLHS